MTTSNNLESSKEIVAHLDEKQVTDALATRAVVYHDAQGEVLMLHVGEKSFVIDEISDDESVYSDLRVDQYCLSQFEFGDKLKHDGSEVDITDISYFTTKEKVPVHQLVDSALDQKEFDKLALLFIADLILGVEDKK